LTGTVPAVPGVTESGHGTVVVVVAVVVVVPAVEGVLETGVVSVAVLLAGVPQPAATDTSSASMLNASTPGAGEDGVRPELLMGANLGGLSMALSTYT
jgi:hypothetical protein